MDSSGREFWRVLGLGLLRKRWGRFEDPPIQSSEIERLESEWDKDMVKQLVPCPSDMENNRRLLKQ